MRDKDIAEQELHENSHWIENQENLTRGLESANTLNEQLQHRIQILEANRIRAPRNLNTRRISEP